MRLIDSSLAILSLAILALAGGCVGDGCLQQVPKAFPQEFAVQDAVQVRLTESGLRSVAENADAVIANLFPQGLDFPVPPSCDVDGPDVCCNAPPGTCNVVVDMARRAGDPPRLEMVSQDGAMHSTMRMRVRNGAGGPIMVEIGSSDCTLFLDSEEDDDPSITVGTALRFAPDPLTGTTRANIESITVDGIDRGDIDIDGSGLLCGLADTFKGIALDMLTEQLTEQAAGMINDQLCRRCQGSAQCGPHATCSGDGVCMIEDASGSRCLQDLGMAGRMAASVLHPALPATSRLDVQLIGSGDSVTTVDGFSLGLAAGVMPAATSDGFTIAPELCGPSAPAPARPRATLPTMTPFNQVDGIGEFDVAFGLHKAFLDGAGWAAYQAGLLCITVDTSSVSVLTTDALAALYPSLADLLPDGAGQVAVRMRPQAPPTFGVGGAATLEVHFSALDIDMFAMIDENFVRLFTAHTALSVPVDIQGGPDGQLAPVVGDIGRAFTKIEIAPSGMLEESPSEIAGKFPAMGSLVSQLLTELLGSIKLPTLAGIALELPPGGARPINDDDNADDDNGGFMGIFARISSRSAAPGIPRAASWLSLGIGKGQVATFARVSAIRQPSHAAYAATKLPDDEQPVVTIDVDAVAAGSSHEGPIEWQVRVNGGTWSLPTRERTIALHRSEFWLPGSHRIEVRGLHHGAPETTDPSPVVLTAEIVGPQPGRSSGALAPGNAEDFPAVGTTAGESAPRSGGCQAAGPRDRTGSSHGFPGDLVVLLVLLVGLGLAGPLARRRRALRRGLLVGLAALSAPGCTASLGQDRQEQQAVIGRWSDMAVGQGRVVISAYEQRYGDLVVGEVDSRGEVSFRTIGGVPDVAPDPSAKGQKAAHRGGITEPGEDVGAATSIALGRDRQAYIAYHNRTASRLEIAIENAGRWSRHVVDELPGAEIGRYTSLAIAPDGMPGIAYMAHAIPTADGGLMSQLRWAQALSDTPTRASDWAIETLATSRITAPESGVAELPAGTGLFPSAGFMPDGRAVVVFHDRFAGDLMLAAREATGWVVTPLDSDPGTDTGHWASMAIDDAGAIHVVYQEADSRQLRYCAIRDGQITPFETIDDGTREAREHTATHPVGAHAEVVVDGAGVVTVFYQDQFDVSVMVAQRDPSGGWTRSHLDRSGNRDGGGVRLRGGFFLAAGADGDTTWVSSFSYNRNFFPPGRLTVTPLAR